MTDDGKKAPIPWDRPFSQSLRGPPPSQAMPEVERPHAPGLPFATFWHLALHSQL